jgi:hypothetical protein
MLVDDGRVSSLYNAGLVLPALVVIGPEIQTLDILQGPQATLTAQLVLVVQRLLQRGFRDAARWLCETVLKKQPDAQPAQELLAEIFFHGGAVSGGGTTLF